MDIKYSKGIILVSGPVKSGKSKFAEKILSNKKNVTYIATGLICDGSKYWNNRINIHRQRRPSYWKTVESTDLELSINNLNNENNLLIDSLGGYVTGYLELNDQDWLLNLTTTIKVIKKFDGLMVLVAEEVGWGVSPSTKVGNIFRDRLSQTIERIDSISKESWLVLHGRAINLSKNSITI